MAIFNSLFGGRSSRQKDALLDLLLMIAHADGQVSTVDLDRIARAIETHSELGNVDWDDVLAREELVRLDGPLFSDTRDRVARDLVDPALRRFGLSLAARCASIPLANEERMLLAALADAFSIPDADRDAIFAPWSQADPNRLGYVRSTFNDPSSRERSTWAEALGRAESDDELAILMFKASATRSAMTRLSETTQLVSIGDVITAGDKSLRVDAYLKVEDRAWLGRFLARGEAMYPEEHRLWPELLERMESSVSLFIGYAERLPPPDAAALRRLNPDRLLIEKM